MAGVDIRVRCRSCFAVGDGDVSGYLPVYNMSEDTGSRWWPRNVGRALITRSGSRGTAGRHLWSHQRFDKRARKFIGAESGKESSGEKEGKENGVGALMVAPLFRWSTPATMF